MTWRIFRSLPAALLLLAALAGCGSTGASHGPVGVPVHVTLPPATGSPSGPQLARATAVARAWPGSPSARSWDHGYAPVAVPNVWLPADGFHSPADALAYQNDELDLRAALPYSPETGTVRWADGSTLTLPLLAAAQLIKEPPAASTCSASTESCAPPPGRPSGGNPGCPSHQCTGWLVVTAVTPGTREVDTSRGTATIPTWQFTVQGYGTPFSYPAVSAPPATPLPGGTPVAGLTAVTDWTSVSGDGLTLTAHQEGGGCRQPLPGEVYETDTAVVLLGRYTPHTGSGLCPANAFIAPVTFRLSHPLGTRDVLDAATGTALARTPIQPGGPIGSPTP
ncbi:hypothetical protein [Kitasatospora sp. NBC_01302]|uniref:hypothetical protein n=1 Tax=Kitasatospora sp. NBC_01302 TaxID=2903575 RepID=UPI002E14CA15|nr:hypothetical protein OG294_29900 [Kitasatospora sp. NBC_01302]